ncbi:2-dehydro-3-deoxyphosphogluconate aldolase/(4S)-4-hydroxy-2-oxoglutarate aldolase [Lewinella aquimaris]|uniref:2-dehydro-3-deoxyphosphogluconate aldolase/(4S)-4-hydroxy-2-oxoglutarate aldolase n=1 Tax=Neolewinella aquimaris TaxID=1835722 RepID=A0A840E232_9BACT|nr:bifunctional 4-hydroxy-2-oxoglutarate aldolase/2-dehydro-3-deoxy-phosphogluconate aldolase [Neolewinella aquimaris]MBB4078013.1 2-dehydro-3-deoxyphosphogluconate aldolase/(4S)-4-hydroxy-2-oxoglutarate aldolase [Neolewinella aquimaris]
MADFSKFNWTFFHSAPVVAILRGLSAEACERVAEALSETGFTTLEVTINTPDVGQIISHLSRQFPSLNVGAGTVCTPDQLDEALTAGASFVVTPILDEEVITRCVTDRIPVFPGAYTPTEIYRAWNLGATAVKVFPASQLGVEYLKDIHGPLPQIKLVPTGGVSLENIASFFAAGVYGVGMGSSLLRSDLIAAGDYSSLKDHLRRVRAQLPQHSGGGAQEPT